MYKFLILLVYFERPNIVLNALHSINELEYDNFELVIIDDGSRVPIRPIVLGELNEDVLEKTTVIETGDTIEYKRSINGSRHGHFMNEAIRASDSDYVVILCDDDALLSDCLNNLDSWFQENPDQIWTYGHIIPYHPEVQKAGPHLEKYPNPLNRFTEDIFPAFNIDSTQVVYSRKAFIDGGLAYPTVGMGALDAAIFTQLAHDYGKCKFCGYYVQYKGAFYNQMGTRPDVFKTGDYNE
jgi:glycosyltransferase involved in cell wall biosynthesis